MKVTDIFNFILFCKTKIITAKVQYLFGKAYYIDLSVTTFYTLNFSILYEVQLIKLKRVILLQ